MTHEWDEKDIKELFLALRQEDERVAPSFAAQWTTALAQTGTARRASRAVRVVAATTALVAGLGVSVVILRHAARPPAGAIPIFQWRSPTGFLLTSPGELLLATVPHLGESVVDIKAIRTEGKNGGAK